MCECLCRRAPIRRENCIDRFLGIFCRHVTPLERGICLRVSTTHLEAAFGYIKIRLQTEGETGMACTGRPVRSVGDALMRDYESYGHVNELHRHGIVPN